MDIPIISTTFGILGAICWSIQLTPQIILNYRRKSATGLSASFMVCWACAGIPLGVYNIVSNFNIALRVQPQILTTLSLVTYSQCKYYESHWSLRRTAGVVFPVGCAMAGIELALVFALRHGLQHDIHWPTTLMAALSAFLLALGVLEQYLAIWKQKSVVGISFLFCGIDAMGDLTSIVSVVFEPRLDVPGLAMYAVELALWLGIFAIGFYFKLMPLLGQRRKRDRSTSRRQSPDMAAVPGDCGGVTLHDLPSSTSVFRTASADIELRERLRGDRPDEDHAETPPT